MTTRVVIYCSLLTMLAPVVGTGEHAAERPAERTLTVVCLGEMLGFVNLFHPEGTFGPDLFDIAHVRVDSVVYGSAPPDVYVMVSDGMVFVDRYGKMAIVAKAAYEPWGFFQRGDKLLLALYWSSRSQLYYFQYHRYMTPGPNTDYGEPIRKCTRVHYDRTVLDSLAVNHFPLVDETRSGWVREFAVEEISRETAFSQAIAKIKQGEPK